MLTAVDHSSDSPSSHLQSSMRYVVLTVIEIAVQIFPLHSLVSISPSASSVWAKRLSTGFRATAANLLSVPVYAWACFITCIIGVVGDKYGQRAILNLWVLMLTIEQCFTITESVSLQNHVWHRYMGLDYDADYVALTMSNRYGRLYYPHPVEECRIIVFCDIHGCFVRAYAPFIIWTRIYTVFSGIYPVVGASYGSLAISMFLISENLRFAANSV